MIRVTGPDWRNTRALQQALAAVPEVGTFNFGTAHCNKLDQLRKMVAAKVRCVPFTEDFEDVYIKTFGEHHRRRDQPIDIWLGRKINHTKGKDILLPDKKFWRTRDFWTKYIPSTAEWRIHIFDGKSIARGLKHFTGDHPEGAVAIRARANDYLMTHDVDPPKGMRDIAKKAVVAVGETYGAVDILVGTDGKFYVLEVNTAPAMDGYTLAAYVKAIRRRFQHA